ncbi:hypothetical protein ACQP3L_30980, partial [Escherichia coli]
MMADLHGSPDGFTVTMGKKLSQCQVFKARLIDAGSLTLYGQHGLVSIWSGKEKGGWVFMSLYFLIVSMINHNKFLHQASLTITVYIPSNCK